MCGLQRNLSKLAHFKHKILFHRLNCIINRFVKTGQFTKNKIRKIEFNTFFNKYLLSLQRVWILSRVIRILTIVSTFPKKQTIVKKFYIIFFLDYTDLKNSV